MTDRVQRLPEVLDTLGIGRQTFSELIESGQYRAGFVIVPGGRARGWMESWAVEYLKQRVESGEAPNVSANLPALSKRDTSPPKTSKRPSTKRTTRRSRVEA